MNPSLTIILFAWKCDIICVTPHGPSVLVIALVVFRLLRVMSAATTAAHSGRGHMPGESLRQESVTMDMLEVSNVRLTSLKYFIVQLLWTDLSFNNWTFRF